MDSILNSVPTDRLLSMIDGIAESSNVEDLFISFYFTIHILLTCLILFIYFFKEKDIRCDC